MKVARPAVAVFSLLFPSEAQPQAGLFIRERMFRIANRCRVVVVSPRPWFPFQGLIRRFRPHFRPPAPRFEEQEGVEIHRPRFLSVPGVFKTLDGLLLALGSYGTFRRLKKEGRVQVIDAHFAYPDGFAAGLIGRRLGLPVCVTLRGTEVRFVRNIALSRQVRRALQRAARVFSVSQSLADLAVGLGIPGEKITVVPNGVDVEVFHPLDRNMARRDLNLPLDARILVSVGALVERKGFHRVIELLPRLKERFPQICYLIVGGPSPEGDWSTRLHELAARLGVADCVRFTGPLPPAMLKVPLSAGDVFVLCTRNEGWANVFLEAMACGLPVVTTDVGGNREVICRPELGTIVPFGDSEGLFQALSDALIRRWDRGALLGYAAANDWNERVERLETAFTQIVNFPGSGWERRSALASGKRQ